MKKSSKWRGLAALGLFLLLAACIAWAAPEEPATSEESPKILARVDGQEITEEDVDKFLQSMGPQGMMMYGNEEGRKLILDELISMRLFALDGAKAKLDETPEFKRAMAEFRMRMLAQAAMHELVKDIEPTEDDARKFYDEHQEQFMQPERVHARHILLSDDVTSADTMAKVQADLKAGVSFDEIAKAVSTCPSAPQGGDLGEFQRGQMVPDFEAAAFALAEPGDVSEPVKTQFGWHIIKLERRIPAAPVPFEQVRPQIMQQLENEKISELLQGKAEELRKAYMVEIVEPASDDRAAAPTSDDTASADAQ